MLRRITCDVKAQRSTLKIEEHYEEHKQTHAGTRARTYKKHPHTRRDKDTCLNRKGWGKILSRTAFTT